MPSGKRSCLAAAEPILAFSLKDQECYPHRWCTAWKRILKDFQGICSEWMFWPQQVKGLVHHQHNPSLSLMNKLLRDVCEGTCPWRLWQNPPQPINNVGMRYRYSCSWCGRGEFNTCKTCTNKFDPNMSFSIGVLGLASGITELVSSKSCDLLDCVHKWTINS